MIASPPPQPLVQRTITPLADRPAFGRARPDERIDPAELQARVASGESLQVIDVREFPEFAAGHIPCARLLPLSQLEVRAAELDRNIPLVCVCRSGKRSEKAASKLRALGFREVIELAGGIMQWELSGLPLAREAHAPWSLERQVRFALGTIILAGLSLSLVWPWAIALSWVIGMGMVFTAFIDWCGMALLLARAPWNKQGESCCAT